MNLSFVPSDDVILSNRGQHCNVAILCDSMPLQMRTIRLIRPAAILFATTVPPTKPDVSLQQSANVIETPRPFIGSAMVAADCCAAADVVRLVMICH
jgi:hypothetical protein